MKSLKDSSQKYLEELKQRSTTSRVYRSHQLVGLNLATILRDMKHKSLYIKLAKQYEPDFLLQLAKTVAEKEDVLSRGAYFMRMLTNKKKDTHL